MENALIERGDIRSDVDSEFENDSEFEEDK